MQKLQKYKIEDLPIVMLGSCGHAGIDWTHSLLDNHKQVLIMPAFSFFRTIDRINRVNKINIEKERYIKIAEIFSNTFLLDKAYQLKRRKFLENEEQKLKFKNLLFNFLEKSKERNLKKKIFFGIHYAFAKIHNIEIEKKKIIVVHEHVSWHCEEYKKIFNSKFLIIFRDPRASLAGGILRMRNSNIDKILNSFQFDMMLLDMFSAFNFIKKNKNDNKIYSLINEVMHCDLKKEMKLLSEWLNIDYSNTLIEQTFRGEKWMGESAYLAKDELEKEPPKNFYNSSKVEKRWRSILSFNEILMIETIFRKLMIRYNFKPDNKLNFSKLLCGYLNYFIMHQHQKKFYLSKYLILLRNFIRRFSIIFFGSKSKYFFNFR
jgi:hypothetical protein